MIKKNFFSILTALIIMYLSMANSHAFDKVPINIPNFDKFVHFGMYFGLMSVLIFENKKAFRSTRNLFILGLIPLFYGIIIEIMQSTLTTTRTGSIFDALADLAGILVSILLYLLIRSYRTE
jgi:VanZ family protein